MENTKMTLEDYVLEHKPSLYEEYKRATTPHYYEGGGVLYHPITNGYGCGSEGSSEPYYIEKVSLIDGGKDYNVTLRSVIDNSHAGGCKFSELPKSFARIDETEKPIGIKVPYDKQYLHLTINGIEYNVFWWLQHEKETSWNEKAKWRGQVGVSSDSFPVINGHRTYYKLYITCYGDEFFLQHTYSYDSVGREQYNMYRGISVREFKEKVFGDANVKFNIPKELQDGILLP